VAAIADAGTFCYLVANMARGTGVSRTLTAHSLTNVTDN
jgi:hypothetical protein